MSHKSLLFSQNPKKTQFAWCFPLYSSIPPCVFSLFGSQEATVTLNFFFFFIDADSLQDVKRSGKNSDVRCRRQTCAQNRSALVEMTASAKVSSRAKNAPVHIFLLAVKWLMRPWVKRWIRFFFFFLLAFALALTSIRRRGKKTDLPVY